MNAGMRAGAITRMRCSVREWAATGAAGSSGRAFGRGVCVVGRIRRRDDRIPDGTAIEFAQARQHGPLRHPITHQVPYGKGAGMQMKPTLEFPEAVSRDIWIF